MNGRATRITQICGGDCLVSKDRTDLFCTVLGSCIAACIYDPIAGVGGMNHYLLPYDKKQTGHNARYGNEALPRLLEQLYRSGAAPHRLRAKLYGGARMLACDADIGEMNIAFARQFMNDNNIPLADTDLGGQAARWIKFYPATGRSFIRVASTPKSRQLICGN